MKERPQCPRVVVIGGGFGGLHAATFIVIMLDAIATTHLSHGFFMNWFSQQFYKEVQNDNPGDTSRWI
ncbi:MAG: hypothetical protein E6K65_16740 [Nitrospirae bacterium]|nr:MAG: hypothetical protein E6K65_16740 [Nitrospirota bacterium]